MLSVRGVVLCSQLHARELSLAEVRASAEILQSASAQMQVRVCASTVRTIAAWHAHRAESLNLDMMCSAGWTQGLCFWRWP